MKTNLVKLNRPILKVSSLIFGYLFWLMIAQNQHISINHQVPLYFFGLNKDLKTTAAPEQINAIISGKRMDLANFNLDENSAHIDVSNLDTAGSYNVKVPKENIFLHNHFKLLNYWPSSLSIQIDQKNIA